MYHIVSKNIITDEKKTVLFGIADESGIVCSFTENAEEAERFAALCNENGVERNQIFDVVEDFFYS